MRFAELSVENMQCMMRNETKIYLEGDRYMSEEMESKIIKYAMQKIGTQRVSTLDGMTIEYENKWYNIYVNGNEVTVAEI